MDVHTQAVAAEAGKRRGIVRAFESVGAVASDRARPLDEIGVRPTATLKRMQRRGIICEPREGRFFVSHERLHAAARRDRWATVLALVIVLAVVGLVLAGVWLLGD